MKQTLPHADFETSHYVAFILAEKEVPFKDKYETVFTEEEEREATRKQLEQEKKEKIASRNCGITVIAILILSFSGCMKWAIDNDNWHYQNDQNIRLINAMPESEVKDEIIYRCRKVNDPWKCSEIIQEYNT